MAPSTRPAFLKVSFSCNSIPQCLIQELTFQGKKCEPRVYESVLMGNRVCAGKSSSFAGTAPLSPEMKAIVWSSSKTSGGLVPDVSAWMSHRPVSPSLRMQAQLKNLSFKEGHSPSTKSADSGNTSDSQRSRARKAAGELKLSSSISTPHPTALQRSTEGRHTEQSTAEEQDLYHWQSMVRYAQPWNLYGQHLSKPLKRVIGQMTVPDVEDHNVLDAKKVRVSHPSPLPFIFALLLPRHSACSVLLSMFFVNRA